MNERPNKAPEPRHDLSRFVQSHESRQVASWLIFDVGQIHTLMPGLKLPLDITFTADQLLTAQSRIPTSGFIIPRWLRYAFIGGVCAQAIVLLSSASGLIVLFAVAIGGALASFRSRDELPRRTELSGKPVVIRFLDTHMEFIFPWRSFRADYEYLHRVGRSSEGLMLLVERLGIVPIPFSAFESEVQRDELFHYLGNILRK